MKKLATIFVSAYVIAVSAAPSLSWAADDAIHGDETTDHIVDEHALTGDHTLDNAAQAVEHAESKGGLPQFDPEWFASQVFWLVIFFGFLYFFFAKKTLPDISGVIENRKNHIASDLETAEKLTAQADNVHDSYQAGLNKAQSDAAAAIQDVENKAKAKAEKTLNDLRLKSEKELQETEERIEASKIAAMGDMNQICVDAAAQAVQKIIGLKLEKDKIQTVVENINGDTPPSKTKAA